MAPSAGAMGRGSGYGRGSGLPVGFLQVMRSKEGVKGDLIGIQKTRSVGLAGGVSLQKGSSQVMGAQGWMEGCFDDAAGCSNIRVSELSSGTIAARVSGCSVADGRLSQVHMSSKDAGGGGYPESAGQVPTTMMVPMPVQDIAGNHLPAFRVSEGDFTFGQGYYGRLGRGVVVESSISHVRDQAILKEGQQGIKVVAATGVSGVVALAALVGAEVLNIAPVGTGVTKVLYVENLVDLGKFLGFPALKSDDNIGNPQKAATSLVGEMV
ncbi:hypothetical protein NE237_004010 [Protea cynaroides]|uniref:Uncharacterized protein n=1 Tax=Protea cynaroides TaxID=273540 RepID=A0A9Q0KIK6_9MAGN|nr:hypothetical protein NE237_004010 [Protea cynaroides]